MKVITVDMNSALLQSFWCDACALCKPREGSKGVPETHVRKAQLVKRVSSSRGRHGTRHHARAGKNLMEVLTLGRHIMSELLPFPQD